MTKEKINIREEIKLIPVWAYALAGALFAGMVSLFVFVAFKHEPNPPPLPFQIFISLMPSAILAVVVLLVGYVTRDARRRRMNVALWTVLVIFIPSAIGFVLYFLLREPLLVPCPQCGTAVEPGFNFCPKCKFNLRPACPECKRPITPGDKFCAYCAHELA